MRKIHFGRWFAYIVGVALGVLMLSGPSEAAAQSCTAPNWEGKFYNNVNFEGVPAATACSPVIDFNWGPGSPTAGINADNWSVRWTSVQSFPTPGSYQFNATVEDGVRLFVNGIPLINSMSDVGSVQNLSATHTVATPGATAFLTLEIANWSGNAQGKLVWSLTSGGVPGGTTQNTNPPPASNTTGTTSTAPTTGTNPTTSTTTTTVPVGAGNVTPFGQSATGGGELWSVEYFTNPNLEGTPLVIDSEPADGIARNYGNAIPLDGLPADDWSARWTRLVDFPDGIYTFTLRADDAARVLIDGTEILNQTEWADGTSFTVDAEIPAGRHIIVVEYRETIDLANLFLTWEPQIGTTLFPDGCNGPTAGINGSAAACPDRTPGITMPVVVRAGPLYFRPQPSQSSGYIEFLHRGEQYTAVGRSADNIWINLEAHGTTAWSMTEFLTLSGNINDLPITDGSVPPSTVTTTTGTTDTGADTTTQSQTTTVATGVRAVAQGNMRLRSGPGNNFDRVGNVDWGQEVGVLGRSVDSFWLKIEADGVTGWSSAGWYALSTGTVADLPVVD